MQSNHQILKHMVDRKLYIESNHGILYGKPTIKGIRIGVDLILEKLAAGDTVQDILDAYPKLTEEMIHACQSFAADSIKNEVIYSKAS